MKCYILIVLLSACPFPWTLFETCLHIVLYLLPNPIYILKWRQPVFSNSCYLFMTLHGISFGDHNLNCFIA